MGRARSTSVKQGGARRKTSPQLLAGRDLEERGVSIDWNLTHSGRLAEGCDCDASDMHRCHVIEDAVISEEIDLWALAELWQPQTLGQRYGAQRLLAFAHLSSEVFEISTTRGYYGEEIGGIYLNHALAQKLDRQWQQYQKLPEAQQLPHLLKLEYGYVLDALVGKRFIAESVAVKQLVFGARDHYVNKLDQGLVARYSAQLSDDAHRSQALRQRLQKVPLGVVTAERARYRVVDGYHRLRAAQISKQERAWVWVARD
jgi:hypothetical protein